MAGLEKPNRVPPFHIRETARPLTREPATRSLAVSAARMTDPQSTKFRSFLAGLAGRSVTRRQRPDDDRYLMTQSELKRGIQVPCWPAHHRMKSSATTSRPRQNDLERASEIAAKHGDGLCNEQASGGVSHRQATGSAVFFLTARAPGSGARLEPTADRRPREIDEEVRDRGPISIRKSPPACWKTSPPPLEAWPSG